MLEILVPQILAQIASVGVEKAIDWAAKQIQLMSKEQATQLNQKGKAGDTGFSVRHTFPKGHVGYVLIRLLNLKDSAEVVIIWGPWVRRLVLDPSPEQYLLLRKGNDAVPLAVLSTRKLSVEFVHQVTNIDDDKWLKAK